MLVQRYYMKDIRDFEERSGTSVLKLFEDISISNLITLVRLGNKGLNDENASLILDNYLGNVGLAPAYEEVKKCLLGYTPDMEDDANCGDLKDYTSITDIYTEMCMSMMALGVSYTEFWAMSTDEMYKVLDSIRIKTQYEVNQQLLLDHTLARMIGASVWGKLPAEIPKIDINADKDDKDEIVYVEGYGEMDKQTSNNLIAMRNRRARKKGVETNG